MGVEYHDRLLLGVQQLSLSLIQARRAVIDELTRLLAARPPAIEEVPLEEACGRTLAIDLQADRDQPPFHRSTRDGFAVRAADLANAAEAAPVALALVGEVAAGAAYAGTMPPGSCVEIMTGAPVPAGADAVVMVEHVLRPDDPTDNRIRFSRPIAAGENVVPRGSELATGAVALPRGKLVDAAAIGLLAALGAARPTVVRRPRVAVLATGDELVAVADSPAPQQIRDSNRHALAAQIARAGAEVVWSAVARDDADAVMSALSAAVEAADVVLVSGGVSMGKYDHVEGVLDRLGARILFDAVDIRPGKPLVFGVLQGKPLFGLPGNPLSTYVTFELFVRPALAMLAGGHASPVPSFTGACLQQAYAQRKSSLTIFLPARLGPPSDGQPATIGLASVAPLASRGSGDLFSLAAADVLMVVPPGTERLEAGTAVSLLPK